jgi:hypothetical protein
VCHIGRSVLNTYLLEHTLAATYSSVIASVGVALSAAQELATASGPHGPKAGVFALWSVEFRISYCESRTE